MPLTYNPKVHDVEVVHAQFNRLMNELIKGTISRNTFQPWEIELLLDIQSADLGRYSEREIYKRYQKAVQRAYEARGENAHEAQRIPRGLEIQARSRHARFWRKWRWIGRRSKFRRRLAPDCVTLNLYER